MRRIEGMGRFMRMLMGAPRKRACMKAGRIRGGVALCHGDASKVPPFFCSFEVSRMRKRQNCIWIFAWESQGYRDADALRADAFPDVRTIYEDLAFRGWGNCITGGMQMGVLPAAQLGIFLYDISARWAQSFA
jgi:hypothetical protein